MRAYLLDANRWLHGDRLSPSRPNAGNGSGGSLRMASAAVRCRCIPFHLFSGPAGVRVIDHMAGLQDLPGPPKRRIEAHGSVDAEWLEVCGKRADHLPLTPGRSSKFIGVSLLFARTVRFGHHIHVAPTSSSLHTSQARKSRPAASRQGRRSPSGTRAPRSRSDPRTIVTFPGKVGLLVWTTAPGTPR